MERILGMFALIVCSQQWLASLGNSASDLSTSLGGLGILLLAVADSSFLSIPEANDLLIVILSTGGTWSNMAYFVGMTVTGSVIGCFLLYSVGRKGGRPLLRRRFSEPKIERAEKLFKRFGVFAVMLPSILPPPMPFKIFVLSAGVFRLSLAEFLAAVMIGRTIRYSMWGVLAVLYGNSIKLYMQQNLDKIGLILVCFFTIAITSALFFYLRLMKSRGAKKTSEYLVSGGGKPPAGSQENGLE